MANNMKYDTIAKENMWKSKHSKMRKEVAMIPKDPVMLLSFINLKLRDYYKSLEVLCEDLDLDKDSLIQKLETIDYHYDGERNQFV